MDIQNKLLGSHGRQTVIGSAATPVRKGFVAYGCSVRVDDTNILAWTLQTGEVVDDDSDQGIDLAKDEWIPFATPIKSITLEGASDSVTLWLQPNKE